MEINQIDKSDMRKVILDFPNQFRENLKLTKDIKIKGGVSNIIVAGVGGSALPADILNCSLQNIPPLFVHKDYNLPPKTQKNSLIVCVSYSGNTEEPISSLKTAISQKLSVIGVSSGGKIEEICKQNDTPFVKIPEGIQPRSATGYLFSALLKILKEAEIIKDASDELKKLAEKLDTINAVQEKKGQELAKKLKSKIPVIYASNIFKSLAQVWKIKFNENSKIPALCNYFPELNHNEMVGFTDLSIFQSPISNFHLLILRDEKDHPRNLKRMDLTSKILENKGIGTTFIDLEKGGTFYKIFSNLLLGDWASYYLALGYETDPTPVKMVEEFKKQMEE